MWTLSAISVDETTSLVLLPEQSGGGVLVQSGNGNDAGTPSEPQLETGSVLEGETTVSNPLLTLNSVQPGDGLEPIEYTYIELVNAYRAENGLSSLSFSQELTVTANRKAHDIIHNNAFSHTWSSGESVTEGLTTLYSGSTYSLYAENLAVGAATAENVHQAWIASTPHRESLLNPDLESIGVAYLDGTEAGFQFGSAWVVHLADDLSISEAANGDAGTGDFDVAFDPADYLTANPDLVAAGITVSTALNHYVESGYKEGRNLDFDPATYLALNPDLVAAGFGEAEALAHFKAFGWVENRATSFDGAAYLAVNPDLTAGGIATPDAALAHYLNIGQYEGRVTGFDYEAYLAVNPELVSAGLTNFAQAFEHYQAFGATEGRAFADREAYLSQNSDVAAAGVDALDHYQAVGAGAGLQMPLRGSELGDLFQGSSAAESYRGLSGSDLIFGRYGDDRLDGGAGDDVISGGAGANWLTGGAGADRFRVGEGQDVITDFNAADGDSLVGPDGVSLPTDGTLGAAQGTNLLIDFGAGLTVTLVGVLPVPTEVL